MDAASQLFWSRLGLVISIVAFFFVTPEIIGEERLKRLGSGILVFFIRISWLLVVFGIPTILFSLYEIDLPIPDFVLNELDKLGNNSILGFLFCGVPFTIVVIYAVVSSLYVWQHEDEIVNRIFYNQDGRRRLLIIGAVLFLISTYLQYIGAH